MSRWSSGSRKSTVSPENDGELVVQPWHDAPVIEVIDIQAEEVETNSDQYMNKLVDKVRQGLKPDFDAVHTSIAELATEMTSQGVENTSRFTTVNASIAELATDAKSQGAVTISRFDNLDQRFGGLDESLQAIKKHLGI